MCGIFAVIGEHGVTQIYHRLRHRGPDNTVIRELHLKDGTPVTLGFHRLAIMDTSCAGDQPLCSPDYPGVYVICNGEIYNWRELAREGGFTMRSSCDCEVILHMYNRMSFDRLVSMLDGYFSIILVDCNESRVYAARDIQGVRPLYSGRLPLGSLALASEMKALAHIADDVAQINPRTIYTISGNPLYLNIPCHQNARVRIETTVLPPISPHMYIGDSGDRVRGTHDATQVQPAWMRTHVNIVNQIAQSGIQQEFITDAIEATATLRNLVIKAVTKRCNADRPMACMLSGGLDSSLVAAIAARHLREVAAAKGVAPTKLRTFSIGFGDTADLHYAKVVANHIGSEHTTVKLTEADFLAAVEDVIGHIESYDITSVRASVGHYLLCKYIRENTDCKVVFVGDYSDEMFGSYQYAKVCDDPVEFYYDNVKLVNNIHFFDALRSDRCASANGLEVRVPFADLALMRYVMRLHPVIKMHHDKCEKWILREAFRDMLPNTVLYRPKCAFSDGVSDKTRSWSAVITEHVNSFVSEDEFREFASRHAYLTPPTREAFWYREVYESHYPDMQCIPYFWMPNPKWVPNATDPSARTLEVNKE